MKLQMPNSVILELHSKKDRKQRDKAFKKFRSLGKGAILLCTDLMARGIDIIDMDWVIQFDLPRSVRYDLRLFNLRCLRYSL